MKTKHIAVGIGVVVLLAGWWAFRPELLFIDQTVSETLAATMPSAGDREPARIAAGQFKGYAHETRGTATVYELDGRRVLRLTNFETSNGPDVHVYLVAARDVMDDATVTKAGFIDLGPMKGNIGDQNYDVPAGVDLDRYQAVTIWCARFGVNFGTAPLGRA